MQKSSLVCYVARLTPIFFFSRPPPLFFLLRDAQVVMTTRMYCWWSLTPCCPIRLWSWNCSTSRRGHTYFNNTILRRTAWSRIISGRLLVWRSRRGPPWPSTKHRPKNGESGTDRCVVSSFPYHHVLHIWFAINHSIYPPPLAFASFFFFPALLAKYSLYLWKMLYIFLQ